MVHDRGINMVTTTGADALPDYHSFGEIKVSSTVVVKLNVLNLRSRDMRIKALQGQTHVEGIAYATVHGWSGFMYEMSRQIGEACDIPVTVETRRIQEFL